MPCGVSTKDKDTALKAVDASVSCGAYTSVLQKKDGSFSVYPRVKKQDKEAFVICASEKGLKLNEDWINPPEAKEA